MKNKITILENGTVRVSGEVADYDNLLAEIDPIGEYECGDGDTIVLFPYDGGFIELSLCSSFIHGESANFTEASFDEIIGHYEVKN